MSSALSTKSLSRRSFLSTASSTVAVAGMAASTAGCAQQQNQNGDSGKRIAVTIDDGPVSGAGDSLEDFIQISSSLREAFVAEKVPGIVFVNERQLQVEGQRDERVRELERWLEDGLDIGNHTYSHKRMRSVPQWEYFDDIVKGETVTRPLMEKHNKQLTWFRYPYLDSGNGEPAAAVERFLAEREYRIAPVTVDYKDYSFAGNYARWLRAGEQQQADAELESVWKSLDAAFERSEKQSQDVLGYQLPHVLLIHCNQMNALTLRQAFQRIRDRGYQFVSLDEAMQDPAYETAGLPPGSMGGWVLRGLNAVKQRG
jgi:peptidoglycan-N-acetylglucosamine deacetylase